MRCANVQKEWEKTTTKAVDPWEKLCCCHANPPHAGQCGENFSKDSLTCIMFPLSPASWKWSKMWQVNKCNL